MAAAISCLGRQRFRVSTWLGWLGGACWGQQMEYTSRTWGGEGSRPNLQPSPSRPTIYTSQLGSGSSPPLSSLQRWRWASTRIWGGGGGEGRLGRAADCRFYFVGYTRIPTTITAPKTTPPPPCLLSCFYPYSRIFSTSSGFLALLLVAVAACARLCVCVCRRFSVDGRGGRARRGGPGWRGGAGGGGGGRGEGERLWVGLSLYMC